MVLSWNSHDIFCYFIVCLLCACLICPVRCSIARAHVWLSCYNWKCLVQWFAHRRHFKNICEGDKWPYKHTSRFANIGILDLSLTKHGNVHHPFAQTKTAAIPPLSFTPRTLSISKLWPSSTNTRITFQWPFTVSSTITCLDQGSANSGLQAKSWTAWSLFLEAKFECNIITVILLTYCQVLLSGLKWPSWWQGATETLWPTRSKSLTVRPWRDKGCWLGPQFPIAYPFLFAFLNNPL